MATLVHCKHLPQKMCCPISHPHPLFEPFQVLITSNIECYLGVLFLLGFLHNFVQWKFLFTDFLKKQTKCWFGLNIPADPDVEYFVQLEPCPSRVETPNTVWWPIIEHPIRSRPSQQSHTQHLAICASTPSRPNTQY